MPLMPLMTENQWDVPAPDEILELVNYVVSQAKSGITGNHWDPRFANPLVAGPIPVGARCKPCGPTRACEPRHHAEPCVRGRLWPPWARSEISDRLGTD